MGTPISRVRLRDKDKKGIENLVADHFSRFEGSRDEVQINDNS